MDVRCERCDAAILAENVNINAMMAKCNSCNAVFSIAGAGTTTKPRRDQVEMPKSITVKDTGRELTIVRKWLGTKAFIFVPFTVIWNGFIVMWFSISISNGIWIMAAFGTLHAIVGLVLIYFTAALFMNTTTIKVTRDHLSVTHAPLPWMGNTTLPANMVDQIWCTMKVTHGNKGSTSITYEVHANSKHGKSKKLVSGLDNAEEALFLEQQLESYMQIEDKAVPGAYVGL